MPAAKPCSVVVVVQVHAAGVGARRCRTAPGAARCRGWRSGRGRAASRADPRPAWCWRAHRRRGCARRSCWRRSRAAGAPGRRAGRDAHRPARRCAPAPARRAVPPVPRTVPRPCRAGAGTRSPRGSRRARAPRRRNARCGSRTADRDAHAARAGARRRPGTRRPWTPCACTPGSRRARSGLRMLDLGVPVGALHQAHHDAPSVARGERREPVDHRGRGLQVGLHHQAEALPAA